jgi:hypothetical protein
MRITSKNKRLAFSSFMACAIGALSGLAEHAIDAVLAARGLMSLNTIVDDSVAAILVATVVLCLSLYIDERNQRQRTRQRLIAEAEMNHHLRNALAVLKLSPEIEDAVARRRAIESGIARIEFTLKEILPSSFDRKGEPRYFVGPQHDA